MVSSTLSAFPDVLAMAKRVAALSDVYWDETCFPKAFAAASRSWYEALVQFVAVYSFERQGAPIIYRHYAAEALSRTQRHLSSPTSQSAQSAWAGFQGLAAASNHGTNPNVNSLCCVPRPRKISAVESCAGLTLHQHNIFLWATDLLKQGKAVDATQNLRTVRGINWKLRRSTSATLLVRQA